MAGAISADTFIDRLLDSRKGSLVGRQVRGNVSLRGRMIDTSLRALNVTFWGEVDFSDCRFERSLDLAGCSFAKTLSLRNSHVGGSLDLSGIRVRTQSSATGTALPQTVSLDLRGMRIGGDFDLSRATIESGTSPKRSADRGGVLATGIRVGGRTELRGLRTDNFVRFSGSQFDDEFTFGNDRETSARDGTAAIGRELKLDNCRFGGNILLEGGTIGTALELWASQCDGVFFVRPSPKGKTFADGFAPCTVLGTAIFGGIRFKYIDIEGLTVRDSFNIFAAEIGQFRIHFGQSIMSTTLGRLELDDCRISGSLLIPALHVSGSFVGAKAIGARIRGLQVGGSVSVWSHLATFNTNHGGKWPLAPEADELRAVVNGDLEITGCTIGGELDLTNLLCSGRIHLDDTMVTRDVLMRSPLTARDLLDRVGLKLSAAARSTERSDRAAAREKRLELIRRARDAEEISEQNAQDRIRSLGDEPTVMPRPDLHTAAVALSMNNLSCANDVDLTGLVLVETEPNRIGAHAALVDPMPGHVDAQNVTVGRALRLFEECIECDLCESPERRGDGIVAPGAINLSGATLGKLVMSRHSFEPTGPDDRAADVGVVLAGAIIDEVTIADLSRASRKSLNLPRPIDLRDVRVSQWNIFDRKDPLIARHLTYLSLADTDDRFRRRTWLSLERSLRDQGHSGDADFIYRAMERRDEREGWRDARSGRWRVLGVPYFILKWIFFRKPFDVLIGYGTRPLRLLTLIVLFWLAALPFYREGRNFEPSLEMLAAEEGSFASSAAKPVAGSPPSDWPPIAGLMYSLRHHVPVIALAPRDEWALRSTGQTCSGRYVWWSAVERHIIPVYSALSIAEPVGVAESATAGRDSAVSLDRLAYSEDCKGYVLPGAPENWGLLATILNFIAWPFVLAFAINRFLRIGRD